MKEFFDAAKSGDLNKLKECLNKNININILDDEGFTALMLASIFNRINIAEELIKNNADIN
ncbi:ankyrin repeat domain-containing protein, partial [Brachyspira hyodysenteriae]